MIRLVQRHLIIPRGDTGSFSVPALSNINSEGEKIGVLSIFNSEKRIFQQEAEVVDGVITFTFAHEDTKELPLGSYGWDIKLYVNPEHDESGLLINGDEVHSYYAGYKLPICDIVLAPKEGG